MKNIFKILLLAGCLFFVVQKASAQSTGDMRLNEVLTINTDDFEDDYGHKHGWIELFNQSYGTVNIAGCYLSDDAGNLKKYMIPKGDVLTKIKPRQHILFWADDQPFRGTFHINFKLNENGGKIYFTSNDGRTVVDSIAYPPLDSNISYGRIDDGVGAWQILERSTPSTNNKLLDSSKALIFGEVDPSGAIMAITAMSVVFLALILLYLIFKQIGKASVRASARKAAVATGNKPVVASKDGESGEIYAAIAVALELYRLQEEAHDIENTILTIHRVARTYSPWSSKIYGLRDVPKK